MQNTHMTLQTFIELTSEISIHHNASTQLGVSLDVATGALGRGFQDWVAPRGLVWQREILTGGSTLGSRGPFQNLDNWVICGHGKASSLSPTVTTQVGLIKVSYLTLLHWWWRLFFARCSPWCGWSIVSTRQIAVHPAGMVSPTPSWQAEHSQAVDMDEACSWSTRLGNFQGFVLQLSVMWISTRSLDTKWNSGIGTKVGVGGQRQG